MAPLSFTDQGQGDLLLLIHGFPFNKTIWQNFAAALESSHRVITIDLPGFGESPSLSPGFSVGDVAGKVLQFLSWLSVNNVTVVGHSLGGYVALAMVEQNPDVFSRLVLFHSTAFADGEEKKQNRNKTIDFVEKNGAQAFTSNFIGPLFADQHHPAIAQVKAIASSATKESVISYTKAMRDRSDRTGVLKQFPGAIDIIAGEKDGGIPLSTIHEQAALSEHVTTHILSECSHMGMFEKREETLRIIAASQL